MGRRGGDGFLVLSDILPRRSSGREGACKELPAEVYLKCVQAASKHHPSMSKHLIVLSKPAESDQEKCTNYSMTVSKLSDQLVYL